MPRSNNVEPLLYDANGFDQYGCDYDGYDENGYDKDGYSHDGYDENGYDKDGYNYDGYDENGYDCEGYDDKGFNVEGWDRSGFNLLGFDESGRDEEGYYCNGYNSDGYDRSGDYYIESDESVDFSSDSDSDASENYSSENEENVEEDDENDVSDDYTNHVSSEDEVTEIVPEIATQLNSESDSESLPLVYQYERIKASGEKRRHNLTVEKEERRQAIEGLNTLEQQQLFRRIPAQFMQQQMKVEPKDSYVPREHAHKSVRAIEREEAIKEQDQQSRMRL